MSDDFIQIGQANFQRSDILGKPTTFEKGGQKMNRVQLKNGLVFEFSEYESGMVRLSKQDNMEKVSIFMNNAKIYGDYSKDETKDLAYNKLLLDVKGNNNDIDTSKDAGGYNPECGCQSAVDDLIYVQGYGNTVTTGRSDILKDKNTNEIHVSPKTYKI